MYSINETAILMGARSGRAQLDRDYDEVYSNYRQAIQLLQERRAALVGSIQLENCVKAGLNAMIDVVRRSPGDCRALRPTGQKFSNGNPISHAQLAYERAFDAKAIELGIPDYIDVRLARR